MHAVPEPSVEVTDAKLLRRAFATFATGVTVVTSGGPVPHGMTANSFTSVSLDPPLVLVCVGRNTIMHQSLRVAGCFGVSVLAAGQEALARRFADSLRPLGYDEFEAVPSFRGPVTGVPLLSGSIARFECELWRSYDGGDHSIFVGRLLAVEGPLGDDVLLFYRARFHQLVVERSEVKA
jgi:flavin reductase